MKKYFAYSHFIEIKVVEIVKETAKTVTVSAGMFGERKENKIAGDRGYFDTWQEAKDFIVAYWNRQVSDIEAKATRAREDRRKAEAMQEPKA